MNSPQLSALIFDVDGTLAETEDLAHRAAFNYAFAELGLPWQWDIPLYRDLLHVPTGRERIAHYLARHPHTLPHPPADFDGWVEQIHATKTRHAVRLFGDGQLTLRPGVARLIHEARAAGLRLAIATTTARANVEVLLATRLGPEAVGWFEVIGAGKMVARQKPAPDVYQYVLRQLNLPAAQCLAFEDSIFGLTSALGAGLTTVVTQSLYTTAHDFTGAALVLDHLGEPDQPFTVRAGDAAGHRWFDVALARHIHRQANRL